MSLFKLIKKLQYSTPLEQVHWFKEYRHVAPILDWKSSTLYHRTMDNTNTLDPYRTLEPCSILLWHDRYSYLYLQGWNQGERIERYQFGVTHTLSLEGSLTIEKNRAPDSILLLPYSYHISNYQQHYIYSNRLNRPATTLQLIQTAFQK